VDELREVSAHALLICANRDVALRHSLAAAALLITLIRTGYEESDDLHPLAAMSMGRCFVCISLVLHRRLISDASALSADSLRALVRASNAAELIDQPSSSPSSSPAPAAASPADPVDALIAEVDAVLAAHQQREPYAAAVARWGKACNNPGTFQGALLAILNGMDRTHLVMQSARYFRSLATSLNSNNDIDAIRVNQVPIRPPPPTPLRTRFAA
jgi:hypothetical protein